VIGGIAGYVVVGVLENAAAGGGLDTVARGAELGEDAVLQHSGDAS
jgi:hypothetical protein